MAQPRSVTVREHTPGQTTLKRLHAAPFLDMLAPTCKGGENNRAQHRQWMDDFQQNRLCSSSAYPSPKK